MPTDDRPRWDEQRARKLIEKTVLLGLTFTDADGECSTKLNVTVSLSVLSLRPVSEFVGRIRPALGP